MRPGVESRRGWMRKTALCTSVLALSVFGYAATGTSADSQQGSYAANSVPTASPIKHVIILIGENRGLDHTFGVYKPKGKGQTISNILSKGIVNEDGTPGPNFGLAAQFAVAAQPAFYIGPPNSAKTPYNTTTNLMPQPNTNGAPPRRKAIPAPHSRRLRKLRPSRISSRSLRLF
jgi:phospholipase C